MYQTDYEALVDSLPKKFTFRVSMEAIQDLRASGMSGIDIDSILGPNCIIAALALHKIVLKATSISEDDFTPRKLIEFIVTV